MERMKRLIAIGCAALVAATCAFGRDTAIYNGKLTSDLNANGNAVTSLKEPSADSDAATKKYVDDGVANATPKDYDSVKARVVTNEIAIAALASSATNLVASATNEISQAVAKAQSTADGAVTAAATAQATADAATASAAKNAEAIADETTARESADSALTSVVAGKANANEVYKKTETYTQTEIDAKIAAATPSDYETVKSQVAANKTAIVDEATARAKADTANADALAKHTGDTSNPHNVTAAQVGALTDSAAEAKYAQKTDAVMKSDTSLVMANANEVTIGEDAVGHSLSVAIGMSATAANWNGVAIGTSAYAMDSSVAIGESSYAPYFSFGVRYLPSNFYFNSCSGDSGATKKSLQEYLDERATTDALADVRAMISATDATFSNAVNVAARALVKAKLESLDRAKSSIGETIAALQSIYETETK
jgi:hypothetical protein